MSIIWKIRKGQWDMFGIVIIITILVLFGVVLINKRLKKEIDTAEYIDAEVPQSYINALMNTKTKKNLVMSQLIQGCYDNRYELCN